MYAELKRLDSQLTCKRAHLVLHTYTCKRASWFEKKKKLFDIHGNLCNDLLTHHTCPLGTGTMFETVAILMLINVAQSAEININLREHRANAKTFRTPR